MKIDELKTTVTWNNLTRNPKFFKVFQDILSKCLYYTNLNDLLFTVTSGQIIVSYSSPVKDRELDCQHKLYSRFEISIDKNNNLIVDELSGSLESNYGYDFENTTGGKLNTHYSCETYDDMGIEISYQSYGDRYILNPSKFESYKSNLDSVINDVYNPRLYLYINRGDIYCHPAIVGKEGMFIRKARDVNNLGIVKMSKCFFNKDNEFDAKDEYYFNTFYGSNNSDSPEVIHIVSGFPFAEIDKTKKLFFKDDYIKLGLNDANFKDVAKERFLKELKELKEKHIKNQNVTNKYNLMIEKLEKELSISSKRI